MTFHCLIYMCLYLSLIVCFSLPITRTCYISKVQDSLCIFDFKIKKTWNLGICVYQVASLRVYPHKKGSYMYNWIQNHFLLGIILQKSWVEFQWAHPCFSCETFVWSTGNFYVGHRKTHFCSNWFKRGNAGILHKDAQIQLNFKKYVNGARKRTKSLMYVLWTCENGVESKILQTLSTDYWVWDKETKLKTYTY